jgi:hypothetical protein
MHPSNDARSESAAAQECKNVMEALLPEHRAALSSGFDAWVRRLSAAGRAPCTSPVHVPVRVPRARPPCAPPAPDPIHIRQKPVLRWSGDTGVLARRTVRFRCANRKTLDRAMPMCWG